MYYRGVRFAKDFMVQYLTSVFKAAERGSLLFTDGTKQIKFSNFPTIVKSYPIDARRNLPQIIIGEVNGGYIYKSIDKDHIYSSQDGEAEQYRTVGGDIELTVSISIRATTPEERDNLSDIVGIYLSHPDAKDYFGNHGIVIASGPSFSGEQIIAEPNTEFDIYHIGMSVQLVSCWRDTTDLEDRLIDIISDITPYDE
jgi:hypothetical protein